MLMEVLCTVTVLVYYLPYFPDRKSRDSSQVSDGQDPERVNWNRSICANAKEAAGWGWKDVVRFQRQEAQEAHRPGSALLRPESAGRMLS